MVEFQNRSAVAQAAENDGLERFPHIRHLRVRKNFSKKSPTVCAANEKVRYSQTDAGASSPGGGPSGESAHCLQRRYDFARRAGQSTVSRPARTVSPTLHPPACCST